MKRRELYAVLLTVCVFICRMLLSGETMQQFDRVRVFLDEDFTAVEKFTVSGV